MADGEQSRDDAISQAAPAARTAKTGAPEMAQSANGSSAGGKNGSARTKGSAVKTGEANKRAKAGSAAKTRKSTAEKQETIDPIAMLKDDHRKVESLFASFEAARNRTQRQRIAGEICTALKLHAELEERVFYPATRDETDQDDKLDEAQVEHDAVKLLIRDIEGAAPDSPFHAAKVKVLSEYVRHHVAEEEAPDGILEAARKGGIDLARVGQDMAELRQRLERDPAQLGTRTLALAATGQPQHAKESDMARNTGNGDYDSGTRSGGRDRGMERKMSGRQARGFDQDDYDRSRATPRRGEDRGEGPSSSGRSARGERPRRFGGAEGFNEASRRAAETGGNGQRGTDRQSRSASRAEDRPPEPRGQRNRDGMRASRDRQNDRGSHWGGGSASRH